MPNSATTNNGSLRLYRRLEWIWDIQRRGFKLTYDGLKLRERTTEKLVWAQKIGYFWENLWQSRLDNWNHPACIGGDDGCCWPLQLDLQLRKSWMLFQKCRLKHQPDISGSFLPARNQSDWGRNIQESLNLLPGSVNSISQHFLQGVTI